MEGEEDLRMQPHEEQFLSELRKIMRIGSVFDKTWRPCEARFTPPIGVGEPLLSELRDIANNAIPHVADDVEGFLFVVLRVASPPRSDE